MKGKNVPYPSLSLLTLKKIYINSGLDLLLQRSLAWSWSCKGLWLLSTSLEFPGLGKLRPTEDLPQAYSLRGPRLTPGSSEISASCLLPWRS